MNTPTPCSSPWTVREAVYLTKHASRKTPTQLARELGRTKGAVRSFAWRHKILTRDARRNLLLAHTQKTEQGVWRDPVVIDGDRLVLLPSDFESFAAWSLKNGYRPDARLVRDKETRAWKWFRTAR